MLFIIASAYLEMVFRFTSRSQQPNPDPIGEHNVPPPKKKMPKDTRKYTRTSDKRAKEALGPPVDPQVSTSVDPLYCLCSKTCFVTGSKTEGF